MNCEPPSEPGPTPEASRRGGWLQGSGISLLWLINIGLLIALCVWIWNDREFMVPFYAKVPLNSIKTIGLQPPPPPPEMIPMRHGRWLAFQVLASFATVSFLGIVLGLLVGSPQHRGLRSWLLLIALAAGWLGVATGWRDIQWTNRVWTASRRVEAFEKVAAPLRKDWPREDGSSPEFGPFSAYPIGRPRMLSLLTMPAEFDKRGWGFSAIERSAEGGLRFSLTGEDSSAWLEWHPEGEAPASFVGGRETRYELERASPVGEGWFLVRYR